MTINKGQKNTRLLVQPLHAPMSVEEQVAILYCGTQGLLSSIPLAQVVEFQKQFLLVLEFSHQEDVLDVLKNGVINDEVTKIIEDVAESVIKQLVVN